jgi:adenosylcobinamide amidohydrolase
VKEEIQPVALEVPARPEAPASPALELLIAPRWLVARFSEEHVTASWAIVGGGICRTRAVAWHEITDLELRPPVDAAKLLARRLAENGHGGAVGLLTSRRLEAYVDVAESHGAATARCIATVGLSNALRAGDPAAAPARAGTINVLCQVSTALGAESLLEALALAAEARALAVRETNVPSIISGLPSSGTGTDCIVIASPARGAPVPYAGKHTEIGHLIGATVRAAIARGAEAWLRERGGPAA